MTREVLTTSRRYVREYREQQAKLKPSNRHTPEEGGKCGELETSITWAQWAEARNYTMTTRTYD